MRRAAGAARRADRKEDFLALCRAFLAEIDERTGSAADGLGPQWWDEVSSLLRAALGQDPVISRGFEAARSVFLRAGARADPRQAALGELRTTLEQAAARIESLPGVAPISWLTDRRTA